MYLLVKVFFVISALQGLSWGNFGCDKGWLPFPGTQKCVKKFDEKKSFPHASEICRRFPQGHLVSVHSSDQNRFLESHFAASTDPPGGFWIGLHDKNSPGYFRWTDGSPYDFENFNHKHIHFSHGGNCVSMIDSFKSKWLVHFNCSAESEDTLPFVCQTKNDCREWPRCPSGWILLPNSTKCVKKVSEKMTFEDAAINCQTHGPGGNLVSIHSAEQQAVLANLVGPKPGSWIGLNDRAAEGDFVWTDGSPVSYTNFGGPPSNSGGSENCVHLFFEDSTWNDINCDRKMCSICQMDYIY